MVSPNQQMLRTARVVNRAKQAYAPKMHAFLDSTTELSTLQWLKRGVGLRNELASLVSIANYAGAVHIYLSSGIGGLTPHPWRGQFLHARKGQRRRTHVIHPARAPRGMWLWAADGTLKPIGCEAAIAEANARYWEIHATLKETTCPTKRIRMRLTATSSTTGR